MVRLELFQVRPGEDEPELAGEASITLMEILNVRPTLLHTAV